MKKLHKCTLKLAWRNKGSEYITQTLKGDNAGRRVGLLLALQPVCVMLACPLDSRTVVWDPTPCILGNVAHH